MNLQYRGRPVPELGVGAFPVPHPPVRELVRRPAPPRRDPIRIAAREKVVARAWRPAWGTRPVGFGAARWRPEWGNRPVWFGATQWKREFGPQPAWWAAHLATAQSDPPDDDSQAPAAPTGKASPTPAAGSAPADGSSPAAADSSAPAPSGDATPAGDSEPGFFAKHKVALIVTGVIAAAGGATALVLTHK